MFTSVSADITPFLAGALAICPDAVLITDQDGTVRFLNQPAEDLLESASPNCLGRPVSELPHFGEAIAGWLQAATLSPARLCREIPGCNRQPKLIELRLAWATVDGQRLGCVFLRDVTEWHRMDWALLRNQKIQALGALIGGIAHDFNNCVTAIIASLDLMQDAPEFPGSLRVFLDNAIKGGRGGADIMNRLQAYSRLCATPPGHLELAPLLQEIIFLLRHSLGRMTCVLDLATEAAPKPLLVNGDAGQLGQALINLCLNAREAMPHGGELAISLEAINFEAATAVAPRRAGCFAKITVRDTGTGISEENQARLFAPYFTTQPAEKGVGLGLTVASRIVAAHHGWMEAESRVGEGTRMHIFLPCNGHQAEP